MDQTISLTIHEVPSADDLAAVVLLKALNPDVPTGELALRLQTIRREHPHYTLFGAYRTGAGDELLIGIAGAWVATKLWCGRYLEIDNLVVDPVYRGRGVASALISHLEAEAYARACTLIAVDSYASNREAHRLFYRHGIEVWSFHFIKELANWRGD